MLQYHVGRIDESQRLLGLLTKPWIGLKAIRVPYLDQIGVRPPDLLARAIRPDVQDSARLLVSHVHLWRRAATS